MSLARWLGYLTAATALSGGLVAAVITHDDDAVPKAAAPPASAGPVSAPVPSPSAGVLPNQPQLPSAGPGGPADVATAPVSLHYTFDGGVDKPVTATGGGQELIPLGQNGGALTLVPRGAGLAVAYPQRCKLAKEKDCPRAILEGTRDDQLNPGRRPLQYGASVLMTHADLADGANVLQKGYSVGGASQFKLQVDHLDGYPSCVIAGERIYRAEPHLDVADGKWHDIACTRTATHLTITVDGVARKSVAVPGSLSIANSEPLRVGGKGPNKGNDQFSGQIDNVFLVIS